MLALEISARANSSVVVVVCKDNYSTTKEIQFVGTFITLLNLSLWHILRVYVYLQVESRIYNQELVQLSG